MMPNNYRKGQDAENFFKMLMEKHKIPYTFENSWFDFTVNEKIKVEVKSCRFIVRDLKVKTKRRVGRFDFTNKENREKIFNEDIWVCFIISCREQFILYGFINAKQLTKSRYTTLYDLHRLPVLTLKEWLKKIEGK